MFNQIQDQSDNLDFFCYCVVISDLYLFQEIALLSPCFIFSKNLILSFIDKVTTVT